MNAEFRNNPASYRYEIWVDGELAGYAQYGTGRGRITFVHTEVHEPYEGMGLGSQLARSALADARQGAVGDAILPVHRGLHRAPFR
jgi:uncharacterized protein